MVVKVKNVTKLGKGAKVILILLFIGMIGNIFDGDSNDQSSEVQTAGVETSGVQKAEVTETPVEAETPEPVVTETPDKTLSLEDAMEEETPVRDEKEDLEEEYRARLEEQDDEEASENEESSESKEILEDEETPNSGTTMQLSESKKEELTEIVKEYSGSDEVEILYLSPTETSPTGLMMVSYYLDVPPSKDKLEGDLAAIVRSSKQIAEESGITNPSVNAVAMLRDGTGLGVGNYYASTGMTDIFVQPSEFENS
jgi:hypothetical protein